MPSVTDQASERALSGERATRSQELEPLENARFHHSRMTPLAQSHGWLSTGGLIATTSDGSKTS